MAGQYVEDNTFVRHGLLVGQQINVTTVDRTATKIPYRDMKQITILILKLLITITLPKFEFRL